MTKTVDSLRFDSPPVKRVELSIFFEPLEGLLLTSLARLVTGIKAEFPIVAEKFAKAPWVLEDSDERQQLEFAQEGRLPFPWVTFDNGSGQSIGFQDDRFSIRWVFDDGRTYPGFEELADQLDRHFSSFCREVSKQSSASMVIKQVRCVYENDLENTSPVAIGALATGQTIENSPEGLPFRVSGGLVSGDVRFEEGSLTEGEFVAAAEDGGGTFFGIRSTTKVTEEMTGESVYARSLAESHDRLLSIFEKLTTKQQKALWGRINE